MENFEDLYTHYKVLMRQL